jgi:protein NRD1
MKAASLSFSPLKRLHRSTDVQIGTNLAGLQANQVVLLQQLVERAKAGNNNGTALPLQGVSTLPVVAPPSIPVSQPSLPQVHPSGPARPSVSHNSPPRDAYGSGPRDEYYGGSRTEHSRWHEPPGPHESRTQENEEWHERDRPGWRGGYRGGSRGGPPGRGGRQGWRDHDDWDTRPRRRHSRSRSPPRFSSGRGGGGRSGRDIRPYSPPRRPSLPTRDDPETSTRPIASAAVQPGKDEFGRDIRPASPNTPTTSKTATTPPGPSAIQRSPDSHHPSSFAPSHAPPHQDQSPPASGGLDQVDFTTFNFSSPAAWEALGKAWKVTHGYLPSQEQLMELVVGRMAQADAPGDSMNQGHGGDSHADNGWAGARQPQPGKSIPTYESGSNLKANSWQGKRAEWQSDHGGYDNEHGTARLSSDTDAVVLGGGETQGVGGGETQGTGENSGRARRSSDSSSTGGMKRVGDGWVWRPS